MSPLKWKRLGAETIQQAKALPLPASPAMSKPCLSIRSKFMRVPERAAMAVRTLAPKLSSPGELLAQVNLLLCERNETMQFVTACAVFFDPANGELAWANAGHPVAAVISAAGRLTWLEGPRAVPLGVFEETQFVTQRQVLAPQETLLVYSDGVSEAMDAQSNLFGSDRIQQCLAGGTIADSAQTVDRVVAAVLAHQAEAPQADDITLVALRRML
jgi:sigma-B regulation protein RsbU (phosphoserine phosphatase)